MKTNGFTLIEALFAILLVGLAIASLLGANTAFTWTNAAGTDLSTAEFLLEQIKELTALAAYDDLDDFDDATFSPPVGADSATLNDFAAFTQQVTVENVSSSNFAMTVTPHTSSFVRVTVSILKNSKEICSASWIRAQY